MDLDARIGRPTAPPGVRRTRLCSVTAEIHTPAVVAGFLVMGALLGFAGGLFGIGGGIITIPVLGIFFGFSQQLAQGTAMLVVLPTVCIGLVQYLHRVRVKWKLAATLGVSAFPLTAFTSRLATLLPSSELRYAFVAFLLALAAYIARRAWMLGRVGLRKRLPLWWAVPLGFFCGTVSGLFTVGGAIFSVPIMTEFFAQSQIVAQATSLAFALPGVIVSVIVYGLAGDVDWFVGVPLAIGAIGSATFGVALAHRLPERTLRLLFVVFVLICAAALYVRARELA
jgi:uncharacterized protein